MSATQSARIAPTLLDVSADNWRLAILIGLVVSVLAAAALPASASFWVVGAMAALVAAAFVVNAYRRRYYGGLLVAPAIAVLFVMNIFPLLWSLGLSFFAYQSNQQSIRFVGLNNYVKVLTNDIAAPDNWHALANTAMFVLLTVSAQMIVVFLLAMPIDLLISAGIESGLMGVPFGKGVEMWYTQRLIQLSIVAAIGFVAGLVVLIQQLA